MVSVIRTFVNTFRRMPSVSDQTNGAGQGSDESSRTVTSILIRQTCNSTVQPLIKVIEHAGHQAVVIPNGVNDELPLRSRLSVLVFAQLPPSKSKGLEVLQILHQQIPNAKIIALVDPAEPDDRAVQKCAEQPGVYRVFKDPFNAGGLLEVVHKLLPLESE